MMPTMRSMSFNTAVLSRVAELESPRMSSTVERSASRGADCGHTVTCLLLLAFMLTSSAAVADRPNVLVLLADDLGYGDLACYGHPIVKTPNIDRLASQGIRFTNCYSAAPNCSPARTGLMTGRTPWRVGVHNWIPFLSPMHVRESEITIATLLRDAGYHTGHFGKWHLNGWFNLPGQPQPNDHGFDHWFSTQNNALPNHRNPYNFVRNTIPVGPLEGYAGDLVAAETVSWLKQLPDDNQPFFAYVCFHEPHEPIASAPKYMKMYEQHGGPSLQAHHGNITQLDTAVGEILDGLEKIGRSDSTLVIFTSDNGPAVTRWHPHGTAGPFREIKGHVYDGGIHVPGIVRWPGKVSAEQTSETPVIGTDVLPTLCDVAGIDAPTDRALDGTSLKQLLLGQTLQRERPLYWHFYKASSAMQVAIRDGDWKLLAQTDGADLPRPPDITQEEIDTYRTAELANFELYHVLDDPAESQEMSKAEPERFAAMKQTLTDYYREVRDESPSWPIWEWPRYEGQRIEWPKYDKPAK